MPDTRFGAILRATKLLAANRAAYTAHFEAARATHGAELMEDGSRVSTIVENLRSDKEFACLLVFNALTTPVAELLVMGQREIRTLPMGFWGLFNGFLDLLHMYWRDAVAYLQPKKKSERGTAPLFTSLLAASGIALNKAAFDAVLEAAVSGISLACQCQVRSLAEPAVGLSEDGKAIPIRAELKILGRREQFCLGKLPAPGSGRFLDWADAALGGMPLPAWTISYSRLYSDHIAGKALPDSLLDTTTPEDTAALIAWWQDKAPTPSKPSNEKYAPVVDSALRALCIPISQAAVERMFSIMSNRQIDNRLGAGPAYVSHMLALSCNYETTVEVARAEASAANMDRLLQQLRRS